MTNREKAMQWAIFITATAVLIAVLQAMRGM